MLLILTEINECATSNCQNGGTCVDKRGSYTCVCDEAFTGIDCETGRFYISHTTPMHTDTYSLLFLFTLVFIF